jgi:hypothetical protein
LRKWWLGIIHRPKAARAITTNLGRSAFMDPQPARGGWSGLQCRISHEIRTLLFLILNMIQFSRARPRVRTLDDNFVNRGNQSTPHENRQNPRISAVFLIQPTG